MGVRRVVHHVRAITALALAAVAVTVPGCSTTRSAPPATIPPWPTELSACASPAEAGVCAEQLASMLEQNILSFTDGTTEVTHEAFILGVNVTADRVMAAPPATSYEWVTPTEDNEASRTDPVQTKWGIGNVYITLWACFEDGTVSVGTAMCG
jgi:hypothetical protein